MEKQLTPIQELVKRFESIKENDCKTLQEVIFFDGILAVIDGGRYLEKEKQSFIDFGKKLLNDQVGNDGCGCFKEGGLDKPEELFDKTFQTK